MELSRRSRQIKMNLQQEKDFLLYKCPINSTIHTNFGQYYQQVYVAGEPIHLDFGWFLPIKTSKKDKLEDQLVGIDYLFALWP